MTLNVNLKNQSRICLSVYNNTFWYLIIFRWSTCETKQGEDWKNNESEWTRTKKISTRKTGRRMAEPAWCSAAGRQCWLRQRWRSGSPFTARTIAGSLSVPFTLTQRRSGRRHFAVGSEDAVCSHVEARQPDGQSGAHFVRDGAQGSRHARHAVGRGQVVRVDVERRVDSCARPDRDGDGVHRHSTHHRPFFTCSWQHDTVNLGDLKAWSWQHNTVNLWRLESTELAT